MYAHYEGSLGETARRLIKKKDLNASAIIPYNIYFDFSTNDLRQNLFIGNTPFPEDDLELELGDAFILSYECHYSDGSTRQPLEKTTVELVPILTGSYMIEESFFHGICTLGSPVFDSIEVNVRAVSINGYIVEAVGPYDINDDENNWVYFYVDEEDMVHIPLEYQGEMQTAWEHQDPIITPASHPEYFNNVPNIPNQVYKGDDDIYRIRLNLGYYRESGARELEQILRKLD